MKYFIAAIAILGLTAAAWPESTPKSVLAEVTVCGTKVGYILVQPDMYVGSFDVLDEESLDAQRLLVAEGRMRLGAIRFAGAKCRE